MPEGDGKNRHLRTPRRILRFAAWIIKEPLAWRNRAGGRWGIAAGAHSQAYFEICSVNY